jgi:CBS domain-containing protein
LARNLLSIHAEEGRAMSIGDYCQKPAATVGGEETVRAAAQRMKREGLGSLVVVKDGGPLGIVTDRDLMIETLCNRIDPGTVRVEEVVAGPLLSVGQEAPVREAIRIICRKGVRRLPVVDEKQQLVGIVAADDLLQLIAAELSGLAVAVRAQSPGGDAPQERVATAAADHYRKEVATIAAEATARDAADAMKASAVGSLVVLRDGRPAGIITDRDLLRRVVAGGRDAASTPVAEVMSEPLQVLRPEEPLERAVELMSSAGIRRVPVVRNGELVGIVTLDDVLANVADELQDIAQGMRRELVSAQREARARALAREAGERMRDLGGQLEHLGSEAKRGLLRELDSLRERFRSRKD